jgi:hypothetical protein
MRLTTTSKKHERFFRLNANHTSQRIKMFFVTQSLFGMIVILLKIF